MVYRPLKAMDTTRGCDNKHHPSKAWQVLCSGGLSQGHGTLRLNTDNTLCACFWMYHRSQREMSHCPTLNNMPASFLDFGLKEFGKINLPHLMEALMIIGKLALPASIMSILEQGANVYLWFKVNIAKPTAFPLINQPTSFPKIGGIQKLNCRQVLYYERFDSILQWYWQHQCTSSML